jgi:hypothetical protein
VPDGSLLWPPFLQPKHDISLHVFTLHMVGQRDRPAIHPRSLSRALGHKFPGWLAMVVKDFQVGWLRLLRISRLAG